ncbi:MAG: radical SAM protein [Chloroflexi bacterium]|nr:radical SAM protein [Chloroflexota bacterium]
MLRLHDTPQAAAIDAAAHVFAVPLRTRVLIYAPLHNSAAIIDRAGLDPLRQHLAGGDISLPAALADFATLIATPPPAVPGPKSGPLIPSALGILSTRACNLACRYCGFLPETGQQHMPPSLARDAVNWYMDTVATHDIAHAEIHFFGGEPFCAEDVVEVAVHLGRRRATEIGCSLRFEVATNGTFSEARCHWVADNIDTVILSFDGTPDIHNKHRPRRDLSGSYDAVHRNALILAEGNAALSIRACITDETVTKMPELAAWFCETFHPEAIGFETLQPTQWSQAADLHPPDALAFARNFMRAAEICAEYGVQTAYAASNISAKQVTFCPVGKDFVIIAPDGTLSACYLRRYEWEAKNMDLAFGRFDARTGAHFDLDHVAFARSLNVHNKPLCDGCFNKWHCAGGCHVNHSLGTQPGDYDRLCVQSRLITLYNILKALDQVALLEDVFDDAAALQRMLLQPSDRIDRVEVPL